MHEINRRLLMNGWEAQALRFLSFIHNLEFKKYIDTYSKACMMEARDMRKSLVKILFLGQFWSEGQQSLIYRHTKESTSSNHCTTFVLPTKKNSHFKQ